MKMSERNELLITLQNSLGKEIQLYIRGIEEDKDMAFTRTEITDALKAIILSYDE